MTVWLLLVVAMTQDNNVGSAVDAYSTAENCIRALNAAEDEIRKKYKEVSLRCIESKVK